MSDRAYRWCVMLTPQLDSQYQQTRGTMQLKFSATLMLLQRNPGMCSNFSHSINFCYQYESELFWYFAYKQVRHWARVHIVAERHKLATWVATWRVPWPTGKNNFPFPFSIFSLFICITHAVVWNWMVDYVHVKLASTFKIRLSSI